MCKQLLFFCLLFGKLYAQNLVPNPSFEDYIDCPAEATFTPDQAPIHQLKNWYNASNAGVQEYTEYFNQDFVDCLPNYNFGYANAVGYQKANKGKGYIGMFCLEYEFSGTGYTWDNRNKREFMGIKLTEKLRVGEKYKVISYINLANKSYYSINRFGFYFSANPVYSTSQSERIDVIAQVVAQNKFYSDTVNWEKVEGEFIAQGGEEYLTIGNFWHIDDVDTLRVSLDLYLKHSSYYYIDDVSVECMDCTVGINEEVKNKNTIFYNSEKNTLTTTSNGTLVLYSVLGNKVLEQKTQVGESLHLPDLAKGLYVWQFQSNTENTQGKFVVE